MIIVTSDHGMEFDENGLGFTGHGTAYSELQLHTPLLIRWPGRSPGRVSRRTSHFDMAPTLLSGVFGCTNPPSDYASGQDLFDGRPWEWLIAASHRSFALVEPDEVTIVSPTSYEIRDGNYRRVRNAALPRDRLRAAQQEMRVMHDRHPGPPSKTGAGWQCRAGLLALGSSYSPPLPDPARAGSVADRGFRSRLQ